MNYPSKKTQMLWAFRQSLKTGLPLSALLTAVLVGAFINALPAFVGRTDQNVEALRPYTAQAQRSIHTLLAYGVLILAALLSLLLFKYLYKREESDFMHALPITRRSLFWGKYLTGLLCLALPILIAGLLLIILNISQFGTPAIPLLLPYLGSMFLLTATVFTLALLGAVLANSILQALVIMAVLAFFLPAILMFGDQILRSTIPGSVYWRLDVSSMSWSSPVIAALSVYQDGPQLNSFIEFPPQLLLFWPLVAVLLTSLAYQCYCKRKTEASTVYPWLKALVSICAGIAAALFSANIFLYQNMRSPMVWIQSSLVCVGIATICQWVLFKSLSPLKKRLTPVLLSLPLLLGLFFSISLGLGLDTAIPHKEDLTAAFPAQGSTSITTEWGPLMTEPDVQASAQIIQLQDLLVKFSREQGYPYPLGGLRKYWNREDSQFLSLYYFGKEDPQGTTKYYWLDLGDAQPADGNTAGQILDLLCKMSTKPQYANSLPPLNCIDALLGVSVDNSKVMNNQDTADFFSDSEDIINVSQWQDAETLLQKLEQALLQDFTAGRHWLPPPRNEITYVLKYQDYGKFTARGGLLNGKPAKGQTFTLLSNFDPEFQVTSQMTETYALLAQICGDKT